MPETSVIEIPKNSAKLLAGLVFCLVGVFIGILCIINPSSFYDNFPLIIRTVGAILILVFGWLAKCVIKWLFNKTPGLVIDKKGFTDNTVAGITQRVLWQDVAGVSEWKTGVMKLVVVMLQDPHCFIDGHPKEGRRKALLMNLQTCGSPVTINAGLLKISHKKLQLLLLDKYNAYTQQGQFQDKKTETNN